jgi:CRISPR-associated protein Cmr5
MNKKNIDRLIPKAIQALTKLEKNGSIDKVYQGYLAAFGPTVIMSGLKKSVAIYADKSDSNQKRREVTRIMFSLIGEDVDTYIATEGNERDYALKHKILEANIACKLAIRTFDLKENGKG